MKKTIFKKTISNYRYYENIYNENQKNYNMLKTYKRLLDKKLIDKLTYLEFYTKILNKINENNLILLNINYLKTNKFNKSFNIINDFKVWIELIKDKYDN